MRYWTFNVSVPANSIVKFKLNYRPSESIYFIDLYRIDGNVVDKIEIGEGNWKSIYHKPDDNTPWASIFPIFEANQEELPISIENDSVVNKKCYFNVAYGDEKNISDLRDKTGKIFFIVEELDSTVTQTLYTNKHKKDIFLNSVVECFDRNDYGYRDLMINGEKKITFPPFKNSSADSQIQVYHPIRAILPPEQKVDTYLSGISDIYAFGLAMLIFTEKPMSFDISALLTYRPFGTPPIITISPDATDISPTPNLPTKPLLPFTLGNPIEPIPPTETPYFPEYIQPYVFISPDEKNKLIPDFKPVLINITDRYGNLQGISPVKIEKKDEQKVVEALISPFGVLRKSADAMGRLRTTGAAITYKSGKLDVTDANAHTIYTGYHTTKVSLYAKAENWQIKILPLYDWLSGKTIDDMDTIYIDAGQQREINIEAREVQVTCPTGSDTVTGTLYWNVEL